MRDTLESLSALAGERLGDERLLDACPFAARGFIKTEGAKTAHAIRGVPNLSSQRPVVNAVAGDALPNNLILALTPTRLFIFELR